MGIGNLAELEQKGVDMSEVDASLKETLSRSVVQSTQVSDGVGDEEWKERIDSQPVIMQTVEGIWSKHDTENTGYLNTQQAKRFICETLQTDDVGDEDFNDFYNKF